MNKATDEVKILAVDDSTVALTLLVAQLQAAGVNVEAVDSGFAALNAVEHEAFDAVILDVQMPEMDGVAVARALRANLKTARSKIALHTSLPEADIQSRFTDYDAFLPKPCDADSLRETLRQLALFPR